MAGADTSIEDLVMGSARGFLYGHPQAWDIPSSNHRSAVAPGAARRGRLARMLAVRRGATRTPRAAEAGGCA